MIQNIVIIAIVAAAVILLIRHFIKGGCDCCKTGGGKDVKPCKNCVGEKKDN
jgi:hypothetical protein